MHGSPIRNAGLLRRSGMQGMASGYARVRPANTALVSLKSADGKLWFVTGEGIQVIDPRHLVVNRYPPPVHIEQVTADGKTKMRRMACDFQVVCVMCCSTLWR